MVSPLTRELVISFEKKIRVVSEGCLKRFIINVVLQYEFSYFVIGSQPSGDQEMSVPKGVENVIL